MGARCDTDTSKDWWAIVEPIITPSYLQELGERFGFEVEPTRAEWWLTKASALYVRGRRIEDRPKARDVIADIDGIEKTAVKLEQQILAYKHDWLPMRIDQTAEEMGEPLPYFPTRKRGSTPLDKIGAYHNELLRLLGLLQKVMREEHENVDPDKGGRPRNLGMEDFMSYIADFWERETYRRFTIDYHKGEGVTPPFEFAKEILSRLDDVSDSQIITAMRHEIRSRADHINRPSKT